MLPDLIAAKQRSSPKSLQRPTRECEWAQIRFDLPAVAACECLFLRCVFVLVCPRAPHTVRPTAERQEGQLSPEEQEKR